MGKKNINHGVAKNFSPGPGRGVLHGPGQFPGVFCFFWGYIGLVKLWIVAGECEAQWDVDNDHGKTETQDHMGPIVIGQEIGKGRGGNAFAKREPHKGESDGLSSVFREISCYRDCRNLGAQTLSCLLYTSPSPRDRQKSRMPSSA